MNQCLLNVDTSDLDARAGAPVVPDITWMTEIPDAVRALPAGLRTMAWVDLCDDVGRFYSLVAEDGVPFTTPYPGVAAPIAAGARSYYMNERAENAMAVKQGDDIAYIPAGPIGFGHSPESLLFEDEIFAFHDRRNLAGLDRPLIRARLGVEDDIVYATGVLMSDVLMGEAVSILNSEVSPEFMLIDDGPGTPAFMEYVTLSLVLQGNTRTSASMDAHRACVRKATRRKARSQPVTKGALTVPTKPEPTPSDDPGGDLVETLAARVDALETAASAPSEPSPVEDRLASIESEVTGLVSFLMADVAATPIARAAINTQSELRKAIGQALHDAYATMDVGVWLFDVSIDGATAYYEIEGGDTIRMFREGFTVDAENHEVTLAGSPVEVVQETEYIDA